MADSQADTGLIERPEASPLSSDAGIIGGDQIHSLQNTINEEILQQSLGEGNDFDSSSIAYAVSTADETGVDSANAVANGSLSGLGRILQVSSLTETASFSLDQGTSLPSDTGQLIPHNHETDFVSHINDPKTNFPHASTSGEMLNNNGPQTILNNVESDGMYVPVATAEEHNNMPMSDSITGALSESRNGTDVHISQSVKSEPSEHTSSVVEGIEVGLPQTEVKPSVAQSETFPQAIKVSTPQGISISQDVLQSVIQQVKAQQLAQQQTPSDKTSESPPNVNPENSGVSFTLVSPNQQNAQAPLGSSQNPIRIIQQGNRYTPMQQLTPDQLQQIMQVVRQQHVNKSAQDNGGTIIFNPVTNTKIMYRVIYPSELHKAQIPDTTYRVVRPSTLSQEQQTNTPHQKRVYRKRKEASGGSAGGTAVGEDDKGGGDGSELSKEEKEERKKHRPRTRSGRVSKPPKHMVQDYKQLHVLDWDEDYDDSDGGYSDFKHSDEEGKARKVGEEETEELPGLFQGLGSGKPKNYKCQTCDKSYIGQAGLARHHRLNPEHMKSSDSESLLNPVNNRSLDGEDSSKDASINQDGNSSRASDPGIVKANGIENFSEDSNTQDSLNSNGASSPIVQRGRGRGVYRGRWAHLKHNAQMRKKNKLREFAKRCSDEDLMEVLFPRLVGSISTWEFLMMKSEKGGSRPQVDIIYKEFEGLLRHVKQVCKDYMKPTSIDDNHTGISDMKTIKVHDQNLAACLGMEVGAYVVKEMLPDDSNSFSSLHNKLSAATISTVSVEETYENNLSLDKYEVSNTEGEVPALKRKFSTLSPTDMTSLPVKKQKMISSSSSPANHGHIVTSFSVSSSEMKKDVDIKKQNGTDLKIQEGPEAVSTLSSLIIRATSINASTSPSIVSSKPGTTTLLSHISKLESPSVPSGPSTSVSHSQPAISYLITASHNKTPNLTSRAQPSQFVPVVLNSNLASASTSSSQVLPVIISSKNTTGINPHQTIMVAAPGVVGNKSVHSSAMPIVLAAPGSQITGNTMVLTQTNPGSSQPVLIRQSPKQPNISQQKTKVILAPHPASSTTKSQLSLLGPSLGTSTHSGHKATTSQISRFSSNPKPAEVKVSRRLFHEATASSSISSSPLQQSSSQVSSNLSNGHVNTSNTTTPQPHVKQEFVKGVSLANLEAHKVSSLPLSSNSSISANVTDIHEPQFISGGVTSGGEEDMDTSFDISASVLGSIGFSGDELAPLNTSPTVLLSSTSLGTNVVAAMVNEMAAPSSISSGISLTYSKAADVSTLSTDTHVSASDLSLMNGTRGEFSEISPPSVALKDSRLIIANPSLVSSSNFMSSVADLINPPAKPSSPLMSSPSKDTVGLNTPSSVSFSLPSIDSCETLPSQILKSEENPAIMNDLDGLSFSDSASLPAAEHLGGVSNVLQGHSVVSILPEQMTPTYESTDSLLQTSNAINCDDLVSVASTGEEDGQLLLTEGSSIYQTEDGALIIESHDGNRYQLASAQGFPLETVQALVSGNLGEVNEDGITDGNLQTDMHLQ